MSKEGDEKKKFYLLGSDYIYPRTANLIISRYVKSKGLEVVAEKYTPLGYLDYRFIVEDIKAKKPDIILSTLHGDSNVIFFNDLSFAEITAEKTPVCSLLVDEQYLIGLDPAKVQGHLAAASYFQSVATPRNEAFVKRFQDRYAKGRTVSATMEAAYFQVYLWLLRRKHLDGCA